MNVKLFQIGRDGWMADLDCKNQDERGTIGITKYYKITTREKYNGL